MNRSLWLIGLLSACASWEDLDIDTRPGLSRALWNPDGLVVTNEAMVVPLPWDGGLALVRPGEEAEHLPLGDGLVQRVQIAPDGDTVVAFALRTTCEDAEDDWVLASDCPDDQVETHGEVSVVRGGAVTSSLPLGAWYGAFRFSDDSAYAIAAIDPNADTTGGGIVNLTSLFVLDLATGTSWEVAVGFEADRILFTTDGMGATQGAVVLSQNEVAVVDLVSQAASPSVVFPLALDPDLLVQPLDVALTPSEEHALISVVGSNDLYALDLVNPSVNIISLSGTPSAMAVSEATDQTVLVYRDRAVVELLDHDLFEVTTIPLDEVMSNVVLEGDLAVLYSTKGQLDAYRLDLSTGRLDEYRFNWAPGAVHIAPGFDFAVAVSGGQTPRMEIIDLVETADGVDTQPKRFSLDEVGIGVAFSPTQLGTDVLVLQKDQDTLFQLSWPSLALQEVELERPPLAIGEWPGGGFWITHDVALGLVSFYEPGEDVVMSGGFARFGFLEQPLLSVEAP